MDGANVEALVDGRLPRRAAGAFLLILALLFGAMWLSQMVGAVLTGNLPPDLAAAGWPMNPVYVLDLGFVVPLALIVASRLARRQPGAARLAVSFLVFDALLTLTILLMALAAAVAGQAVAAPMVAIFITDFIVAAAFTVRALLPFQFTARDRTEGWATTGRPRGLLALGPLGCSSAAQTAPATTPARSTLSPRSRSRRRPQDYQ